MKIIEINGNKPLSGTVRISGAKNASVALIPAAILSDDIVTICNLPEISDIDALTDILKVLNVKVERATETVVINPQNMVNVAVEKEYSQKLRASYYFMGALLGKYKKVEMYFPGGCNIGKRPINLHLDAFKKLGATVSENDNNYVIEAQELRGTTISLDIASVGATINIMLAAVKAKGTTIIENAAREPEIVNVATFLNNMGAKISGAGTSSIKIKGVNYLGKGFVEVIPDRIEAGTYAIIGALLGHNFKVDNIIPSHLDAMIEKLKSIGCNLVEGEDYLLFDETDKFKSAKIKTQVYPGFPTDLQQPFSVLLSQCNGQSKIEETIYENRFMHISYLNDMGANITVSNDIAIIKGPTKLSGKEVKATDLRAGAAMVVAGLLAEGKTVIKDADHILRGYENLVEKLTNLGAEITIKME